MYKPLILSLSFVLVSTLSARADPPAPAATPSQTALLDVLKSNASLEQKAIACHQLAWIGNRDAVPVLAGLLTDEKLSHMARYALEQNPDPSVDEALRAAVPKLKGKLLAGVLSSLGARRDAKSIDMLSKKVMDADADVAVAAAFALGKIGTSAAGNAIEEELFGPPATGKPKLWDGKTPFLSRPTVVELALCDAALRCADKLVAEGHRDEAVRLYERVAASEAPTQFRVGAIRGAILNGPHAQALLTSLLGSNDRGMFDLALQLATELRSAEATATYIKHLGKLPPAKQALLIEALGRRGDKEALPAIGAMAGETNTTVHLAVIRALGQLDDPAFASVVIEAALSPQKEISDAGMAAIDKMPGSGIDNALLEMAQSSEGQHCLVAIDCLSRRKTASATQVLLRIARDGQPEARQAAIRALARIASESDLPGAIALLQKAALAPDKSAAENLVAAICISASDKEACVAKLVVAAAQAPADQQISMLHVLAVVGGAKGLQAVRDAIKSGPKDVQQAAIVALCVWPDQAAAPDLLVLARDSAHSNHEIRALRGYLRLALDVDLAPERRLEMAAKAQPLIERDDERRLLLRVLSRVQSPKALALIEPFLDTAAVRTDAATAAVAVAGKLVQTADAREAASEIVAAMEKVKQANPNLDLVKKASDIQERARPLQSKKN